MATATPPIRTQATILRCAVGLLLLSAAVLKGYALATSPLVAVGWLGNRLLAVSLVELEGILGLWLLSGLLPVLASGISVLCFALFAAISISKIARGQASCGCFGNVQVSPWLSLAIDAVALIASALALRRGWQANRQFSLGLLVTWIAIIAFAGISSFVFLYRAPSGREDIQLVVLESTKWKGKPWSLLDYIDIAPRLKQGRWAVLMHGSTCGHCGPTLEDYDQRATRWKNTGRYGNVAILESVVENGESVFSKDNSAVVYGTMRGPREWFIVSPTLVVLQDGKVLETAEGVGDCQWEDNQFQKVWEKR